MPDGDDKGATLDEVLAHFDGEPRALMDPERERALLGGLLLDGYRLHEVADRVGLRARDFGVRRHGVIFGALERLDARGLPIDVITVAEELERQGELDRIGGRNVLTGLAGSMPTSAHVVAYARLVAEDSQRRALLEAATALRERVTGSESIEELREAALSCFDAATEDNAGTGPRHIAEVIPEALDVLERKPDGIIRSGLPALDETLDGGFEPGRMYILAARPGAGKTAAANRIAKAGALAGGSGLWSLEMSAAQNVARIIVGEARVNRRLLRKTDDVGTDRGYRAWEAVHGVLGDVANLPLYIDDRGGLSLAQMRAAARRLVRRNGVRVLIVDYLQLMHLDRKGRVNTNDLVGDLSRGLKSLARELDVPVLVLSQLNRECEKRADKRPQVSDLRDSGAIEQDADAILLMWRPEQYGPSGVTLRGLDFEDVEGKVEINVAKNRDGPTGSCWFAWHGTSTSIEPLAPHDWPGFRKAGAA